MFWSRQSQPASEDRLSKLEAELHKTQSMVRQLEAEQITLHDQTRKWMRRAVAADKNAERNQEPGARIEALPVTPAPRPEWGARGRMALRRIPAPVDTVSENGEG